MRTSFVSHVIILFLAALGLALVIPHVEVANLDSLLTSATFLFSVIYGFEISMVISNFAQLKTQLAVENAGLLSIHHLAGLAGGSPGKKVQKAVEQYLLAAIDRPLRDHLRTDKEFFAVFTPMRQMQNVMGTERGQAVQYLNEALYYVPQARNQVAEVAPRFVDMSVWGMLLVLALILATLIFVSHDSSFFSEMTAAVFVTAVFGSLLLLDEIDSNRIQEGRLEYEMFNETLVSLGYDRYYPQFAIAQGVVTPAQKARYRVGVFPHYPSLLGRVIESRGASQKSVVRVARPRRTAPRKRAKKGVSNSARQ